MKMSRDNDGNTHILNKVFENTAAKRINVGQVDVIAPELVTQFLTAMGLQLKVDMEKAAKYAEEIVNYYKPSILWEKYRVRAKLYTLAELSLLQTNYIVRILKAPLDTAANVGSHQQLWKNLFPDSWPPTIVEYEHYLPKLQGKSDEIEQAWHVRRYQLLDLLHLKQENFDDDFLVSFLRPYANTFPILSNYKLFLREIAEGLIDKFIDSIIEQNKATDWLNTELTTYDMEWLKSLSDETGLHLKTIIQLLPKQLQAIVTDAA